MRLSCNSDNSTTTEGYETRRISRCKSAHRAGLYFRHGCLFWRLVYALLVSMFVVGEAAIADEVRQSTPYCYQMDANWCWAASLSMMLENYGINRSIERIAADFSKPKDGWILENGSETANRMTSWLNEYYGGSQKNAWKKDGWETPSNAIRKARLVLTQSKPVILLKSSHLNIFDANGHAFVLTGYTGLSSTDSVFINDPSDGVVTSDGPHSALTWQELEDYLSDALLGTSLIYLDQTIYQESHKLCGIEVLPYHTYFQNRWKIQTGANRLQYDWDGNRPTGVSYKVLWGTYSSDPKFGHKAKQADRLHIEPGVFNYSNPLIAASVSIDCKISSAQSGALEFSTRGGSQVLSSHSITTYDKLLDIELRTLQPGEHTVALLLLNSTTEEKLDSAGFSFVIEESEFAGIDASVNGPLEQTVDEGSEAKFLISIMNVGTESDAFSLEANAGTFYLHGAEVSSVTLNPGESEIVELRFTVPAVSPTPVFLAPVIKSSNDSGKKTELGPLTVNVSSCDPSLEDGKVEPPNGQPSSGFVFSVRYFGCQSGSPEWVRVIIDGSRTEFLATEETDFQYGALFTKYVVSPGFSVGTHTFAFEAKVGGYVTPLSGQGSFEVSPGAPSSCSMVASPNSAPLIPEPTIHIELVLTDDHGNAIPNQRLTLRSDRDGAFIDNVVYTNQSGYADTYYQPEEAGIHTISTLQYGCQTQINVQPVSDPYDITLVPMFEGCDNNSVQYWFKTKVFYKGTDICASEGTLDVQIRDCPTAYFVPSNSQSYSAPLNGGNCDVGDYWPRIRNVGSFCQAILAVRVRGYGWHYQQFGFGGSCPPPVTPMLTINGGGGFTVDTEREAQFSPDGKYLSSIAMHGVGGNVYETKNWTQISSWNSNDGADALDFSPTGDTIVVVTNQDDDFAMLLFDSKTGARLDNWNLGDYDHFTTVAWSSDQNRIAAARRQSGHYNEIFIRNVGGSSTVLTIPDNPTDQVLALDWSRGKLAAVTHEKRVHVWNTAAGGYSRIWRYPAVGNERSCTDFFSCEFSHDGTKLAVVGENRGGTCNEANLFIFNASTGQILNGSGQGWWIGTTNREISSICWSPDDSKLLVAGEEYATVLDASDGHEIFKLVHPEQLGPRFAVSWSQKDFLAIRGNSALCIYAPFDVQSPAAIIQTPLNGASMGSSSVHVAGYFQDDFSFANASYSINGGTSLPVTFDANWNFSFDVPLVLGLNDIVFSMQDRSGHVGTRSLQVTRTQGPQLAGITITGPTSLVENGTGTYSCVASYSDNSTKVVQPQWSDDAEFATISSSGVLSIVSIDYDQVVNVGATYAENGVTADATLEVSIVDLTPPDDESPAAINDLAAAVSGQTLQMSWTAPGDDGMDGRATSYEIRYSTSPIFGESWPSAIPIPQTLTPAPAGTHESFSIAMQSLPVGKYYIAMIAADEVPNWSEISNNAEVLISNSKVSILPLTWYMNWAGTSGTVRAYLGNFPTGFSASNVVASSIRLNGSVAIYNGLSRVRPSMAGFTGSVVEIAFDRNAALASINDPLVPGRRYPAIVTGQFTNGQRFLAVQEIEVFCNATNLYSCYNFPNSISVTTPAEQEMEADDNFLISWTDEDIDNASLITLAYDTDEDVDNGYVEITSDLPEDADGEGDTYAWDLTSVPNGSYYVLAIIDDGIEHTNYDYSPGTVRIEREIITPTGVIAYYPFNGNANDESGNGHDGTGDGPVLSTDRFGNLNASYYFDGSYLDGSGTTINVASSPAFGPDSGIIIDLWIRPTAYPDLVGTDWEYHKGILWTTTESSGFAMWIYADSTIAFAVAPSPWAEVKSQTRVPLNSWTHLRGTYESSTGNIRLFVNDVLEDEIVSNNRVLGEAGLVIGRNPFAWDLNRPAAFEGDIDDIRISTFESSPTPEASYMVYDWYNGSTGQVYRANQDFSQIQQLTNSPYSASMPAISADGQWVVYSQNEADNRANLWIVNSSGSGTPRQLTFQSTSPGQRAFMPSWHPDNQKIYYTQEVNGYPTIREVLIDGTGDQAVTVNYTPAYGPVVNPANPDQLAYISQSNFGQDGILHIRSLASGTETTILPNNGAADYHMSFSPDGQYLLWSEQTGGSSQNFSLRRMHLASLIATTIVEAPGDLNVYGGYSPDGQYVYYSTTHGATFAKTEFWRSLADGSQATLLYTQPGTGRGYLGNVGAEPIAQPSGLIAHYLFDGNVDDETGNGFNGVNHGAQFIPDRLGTASHALAFSGAQQSYVEIPNSGPMVLNDLFTIAFWIRQDQPVQRIVIEKDIIGSVDYDWYVAILNSGIMQFGFGTWDNVFSDRTVGDGRWHHVAFVRNRSTGSMRLYIDGTLDKDDPGHFNNLTTDALIHIGAWDTPGGFEGLFEGALDDVRFYDRILSALEISELYGTGGQDPNGGIDFVENWESTLSLPNDTWSILAENSNTTLPFVEDFGNPGKGLNPGGNGHLHSAMAYASSFQPNYTNGMTVDFDAYLVGSGWHYTDIVVDLNANPSGWPASSYVVRMQFNKNYPNVRNVWMSLYSTDPDHNETMVLPGAFSSDAWNHGRFVIRQDQYVEFYVNGVLLWTSTKTIDPAYVTATSLCIGGQSAGGAARIDNIAAVNRVVDSPVTVKLAGGPAVATLPDEYRLACAYPNPFNPSTTIDFDLPVTGQVKLEIYNIMGQKVRTVVDGVLSAGTHSYEWNSTDDTGSRVASGVYLYRIHAGDFTETKKMVLMK